MWKVVIADDEPNIRDGLRFLLERNIADIEVVGEADNGLDAIQVINEKQPDILLLDICMPHINGLELIDKLKGVMEKECKIIIISGYDEFNYAQKALKLNVMDYILKPVKKKILLGAIENVKKILQDEKAINKHLEWANLQLKKNIHYLRDQFLNDFIMNKFDVSELPEQMNFFGINISGKRGLIVVRIEEKYEIGEQINTWNRYLLLFAVKNIVEELLNESKETVIFRTQADDIIAISPQIPETEWIEIELKVSTAIKYYLNKTVIVSVDEVESGINDIPECIDTLVRTINSKGENISIIQLAIKYIQKNYANQDLSLSEVACYIGISPNYLSRLLKQADGHSFSDFLTLLRINKAIKLMENPNLRINEISEKVGYNTQHYFSTSFKKVLGVSPSEHRRQGS